eukprot:ANDGO_01562.mRNA.1 Phosphoacetylglucosamine mutase
MDPACLHRVVEEDRKFPVPSVALSYGTAGFRTQATHLSRALFRIAIVACLRSISVHGRPVGVMITASHNPVEDNGVKIIDASGEMLESSFEPYATRLVNVANESLETEIKAIWGAIQVPGSPDTKPTVTSGYDTRPSSLDLVKALDAGVRAFGGTHRCHGLVTTPVLHYCVMKSCIPEVFYSDTQAAYRDLCALANIKENVDHVVLDAANGVGALAVRQIAPWLQIVHDGSLVGTVATEQLNHLCGSEHVQKEKECPVEHPAVGTVYASFDGDADRLVFSYVAEKNEKNGERVFRLIDGDKIATLFAMFLRRFDPNVQVTVVQTAYANGSSTSFLKSLGVNIKMAKTGVKYLHHEAAHADVGIYFEANGHGTVLFSPKVVFSLSKESQALHRLLHPTVGCAIRDMLAVLCALPMVDLTFEKLADLYSDMPSKMTKIIVKNRNVFVPNSDETRLVEPAPVQAEIDRICALYASKSARSFVRPSGTEDCVRLYAEAADAETVSTVIQLVTLALASYC